MSWKCWVKQSTTSHQHFPSQKMLRFFIGTLRKLQKVSFTASSRRLPVRAMLNLQKLHEHRSLCSIAGVLGRFQKGASDLFMKGTTQSTMKILPWGCHWLNRDSVTISAKLKSWEKEAEILQLCLHQVWWMLCHYLPVKELSVAFVPQMFVRPKSMSH